jgi:uncharacterized membrane protein
MFFILNIFPEWLWWLLFVTGLSGYFLNQLLPLKAYQLPVKIVGALLVSTTIFIFGLQYADNRWQQAAQELQAKVSIAQAQSKIANVEIAARVITRTQIVKQRGEAIISYIDREVVKLDETCNVPLEFINAHNQAATK